MATRISTTPDSNRRRAVRIEGEFAVTMTTPALGETTIRARNLSAGGILVDLPTELPPGTEVQITFTVPQSASAFVASGEVAEVRASEGGTTTTAVRFSDVACV